MSKFNTATIRAAGTHPITSEPTPTGRNHAGAPGHARDPRSELFLLAVTNMVGENTFYEKTTDRDARYEQLIHQLATSDPQWTHAFLRWLRSEAHMRSASLVGALEAAKAMVTAGIPGSRRIVADVLQRADEPGEALAYWLTRHGRRIPKPVKRGIADAALRLYSEFPWLKYDTRSHGVRFADVLNLTHPGDQKGSCQQRLVQGPWQRDLFVHALNQRHGHRDDPTPETLRMVRAHEQLRALLAEDPYAALDADKIRAAGMTWEDVLSLLGSRRDKAELWTALIPTMGYMALLRNLRNFDQAGVSDEVAAQVAARLADPEQVAKSRQLPFRFLAAHRSTRSQRWGHALDKALTASLRNVPEMPGRTLVLVDRSASMFDNMSGKTGLSWADTAAVFGAALALRNPGRATLVEYGTSSHVIDTCAGDSLLRTVERFGELGGTRTADAVRRHYAGHDRVVLITDEQAWPGDSDPGEEVPDTVPMYTWNLAGYRYGHARSGSRYQYTFGGLADAAFAAVPLIEAGHAAAWPWEQ